MVRFSVSLEILKEESDNSKKQLAYWCSQLWARASPSRKPLNDRWHYVHDDRVDYLCIKVKGSVAPTPPSTS